MPKNIKQLFDETIPADITLSEENKQKILQNANQQMQNINQRKRIVRPIFSGVAIISLLLILISSSLVNRLSTQSSFHTPMEKVTIPNVDYSSLIHSFYIKETNELIYADKKNIYSYSLTSHSQQVLVESSANINTYALTANAHWLVWGERNNKLFIKNRKTLSQKEYKKDIIGDVQLKGNTLIYDDTSGYKQLNLSTLKETSIHGFTGIARNSKADLDRNLLVIPEQFKSNNRNKTEFFVYNLTSRKQVGKYSVPYKAAENVTLINNKIYAAFSNDDERPTILGYIDLSNGEFHEIHTPPFTTYAVYKNYIALSVVEKNTDTVKLYQLENENLKELSIFNNIKERLVMPRFTDDGSLIVNGEAADFSMYLQDVE
ncbi:hypothetical protein [Niallia circulans]|uniref:hypothetical protein n=1 Tax=Niallia circulans TaxID=1397 RepID=UPI001560E9E3|nr:hypothetical protein [Niallia circulans]NRG30817.1 hypothetical protein [Niallia circulans]